MIGALLAVAVMLGSAGFPSTTGEPGGPAPMKAMSSEEMLANNSSGPPTPPPISHVVVVMMENEPESTVMAYGPYENYLSQRYAFASDFYSVHHASIVDYLAATSGYATPTPPEFTGTNLPDLLEARNLSWLGATESMPAPCDTDTNWNDGYETYHNPFLRYADVIDNSTYCDSHVENLTSWSNDVANGSMPTYTFVTPNIWDDGHNYSATCVPGVTNVTQEEIECADQWLRGWLSPLINDTSVFTNSVFMITYDESNNSDVSGFNGTDGGHVYSVLVSPYARMGYNSTHPYNTWDFLTTTEWLLGLGHTGQNDSWASNPPMYDLFAPEFRISGTVTASTGAPVGSARVSLAGNDLAASTETNLSGAFNLTEVNGTFNLTVSAHGFPLTTIPVNLSGQPVLNLTISLVSPPPAQFQVSGSVLNSTGGPIAGTSITASEDQSTVDQVTTTVSGAFFLNLTNGTYELFASAHGYQNATQNVSVNGMPTAGIDFTLASLSAPAPVKLVGEVKNSSSGAPIPSATVYVNGTAMGGGRFLTVVLTNATGGFAVPISNGTYVVTAQARGFAPLTIHVTISGPNEPPSLLSLSPMSNSAPPPPAPVHNGTHGILSTDELIAIAAISALAVLAAGLLLLRRRRKGSSKAARE
ncbi:MAG: carboxypeptidase regulatory-like domain-containing protein [Thermoplasmata archaeon]